MYRSSGFSPSHPCKTCESFTRPEDRNIFSYVMEKHQRNATANGKIMNYLEQTFLLSHATLTRCCTPPSCSRRRRSAMAWSISGGNRGRCMGAIVLAAQRLLAGGQLVVH